MPVEAGDGKAVFHAPIPIQLAFGTNQERRENGEWMRGGSMEVILSGRLA